MLKNRKIELQSKTIRRLRDDNIRLSAENKELKAQADDYGSLIEAAKKYRDKHQKALAGLERAKERYNSAVNEIAAEKKRLRKKTGM